MIVRVLLIINLLLAATADFASDQIVSIIDANLRTAIERALGKAPGASITTTEIATLPELSAPNANITDLTGLEAASNLTRLDLGAEYVASEGRLINSNSISDLSPLAELTRLTRLHLYGNNISDISPLAGLTNLFFPLLPRTQPCRTTIESDLLTLDGLSGNALAVVLTDGGEFKLVGRAGDPGDISVTGGQGFILIAQQATTVSLSGDGWSNGSQGF